MHPHCDNWNAKRFEPHTYQEREAHVRHCSYCCSLHPTDLANALKGGATLEAADQKYGWPHKFYVHGVPSVGWAKFYTEHLIDATDEEKEVIQAVMGLRFSFMENEQMQMMIRWVPFEKASSVDMSAPEDEGI